MGGRGSSGGGGGSDSKAGKDRVSRLAGGATLRMKNPETGMSFNVHAKSFAGVTGYKVSGSKGHRIMSSSEAADWLGRLKET